MLLCSWSALSQSSKETVAWNIIQHLNGLGESHLDDKVPVDLDPFSVKVFWLSMQTSIWATYGDYVMNHIYSSVFLLSM